MTLISTPEAPAPAGHYSQAVLANGCVYVSGMLPTPPAAGAPWGDFEAQVRSSLRHCQSILTAAGCGFDDVVQCTAYIVGVSNWPLFNRVYADVFGAHKPARAVVPVPELHHGALVELQMIAHLPAST